MGDDSFGEQHAHDAFMLSLCAPSPSNKLFPGPSLPRFLPLLVRCSIPYNQATTILHAPLAPARRAIPRLPSIRLVDRTDELADMRTWVSAG